MNERKDVPPSPAKPEAQRPAQPAAKPAIPQAAPPAAAPVRLVPAAASGFGHSGPMFRPISAQAAAPAAPRPQAAAPAPKPVAPVRTAPPVTIAPAKPAARAETKVKPAKPAPAPVKPAAFDPLAVNAWLKGFDASPWFTRYPKVGTYGDGMKAALEAGAILLRGVDRLVQEIGVFAGEQMAQSAAAAEELGSCRSFEALVARQSSLARAHFDRAAATADKLAQMSVALAEEVCEPFADEVDAATNRIIETFAR